MKRLGLIRTQILLTLMLLLTVFRRRPNCKPIHITRGFTGHKIQCWVKYIKNEFYMQILIRLHGHKCISDMLQILNTLLKMHQDTDTIVKVSRYKILY